MSVLINSQIAALVITYNPEQRLFSLLDVICQQVELVVIVDNGSRISIDKFLENRTYPNLKIISLNANQGIAKALNEGLNFIFERRFEWVIQFDQDSIPRVDFVSQMMEELNSFGSKKPALLGCGRGVFKEDVKGFKDSITVITSGSILHLPSFKNAGPYREDFFIDVVDFEYAMRLRKLGFITGNSKRNLIEHQLGSVSNPETNLSWLSPTNHTAWRRYYRARNLVIVTRLYFFSFPLWILKYHLFHFFSIILVVLKENDKMGKLKSIARGLLDGLLYKKLR
jgi:rhamnosyltransferase